MQSHFTGVNYLESDSFSTIVNTLRRQRSVNLLLLDLDMPGCDNFYGLLRVRQNFPDLPIAIVSGTEDIDTIAQAMEFGANAFIPITTATTQMVAALKLALSGGTWVPHRLMVNYKESAATKYKLRKKYVNSHQSNLRC
jgi:DNA-binding NarL/FixJ family response regulator